MSASGHIHVYQLESPDQPQRERPWSAPDQPIITKSEFETLFPYESYTSLPDWKARSRDSLIFKTTFDTEQSLSMPIQIKNFAIGAYVVELTTKDSKGNDVIGKTFFKIGDSSAKTPGKETLLEVQPDQATYKVGDKVKLDLSSASEDITVIIDIEKGHQIFDTHVVHLSNEVKTITIDVHEADTDGFAIHYYASNYNSFISGTKIIHIEEESRALTIETLTFRDRIAPGSHEKWGFKILGKDSEPVQAELLASMYDASLDQFKPHQWSFNPFTKRQ